MNESMESDGVEPKATAHLGRGKYLEDEEGGGQESYEYEAEEEDEKQGEEGDSEQNRSDHMQNINENDRGGSDSKADRYSSPARGEEEARNMDLGLFMLCFGDISPTFFLKMLLAAKQLDLLFLLFFFRGRFLYLQIMFNMAQCFQLHRVVRRQVSYRLVRSIVGLNVAHSLFFAGLFVASLASENITGNPLFIFALVIFFFLWTIQNIAWNFQVADNMLAFVTTNDRRLEQQIQKLEDSFDHADNKTTKTKLKKRSSSSK
jgi:hypothetical protein